MLEVAHAVQGEDRGGSDAVVLVAQAALDHGFGGQVADASERDAFYWVNASNHYLDLIDPEWTYGKYTCNVNLDATCNATWSGTTLRFYREGGGCAATGRISAIPKTPPGKPRPATPAPDRGPAGSLYSAPARLHRAGRRLCQSMAMPASKPGNAVNDR